MNTSHNYLAQFLGPTCDVSKLPAIVAKKTQTAPRRKSSTKHGEVLQAQKLQAVALLDAKLARELAEPNEKSAEVKPARLPQIKRKPEKRTAASIAKEKFSDVSTRSIRTMVKKPGHSVLDVEEVEAEALAESTGFSVIKVRELRRVYRAAVKQNPGLAPHSFKKVMKTFGLTDTELLGRIFEVLDVSRTKRLSFKQFINCIYLFLKGTREQQAKVLFKMIDVSDDRSISQLEMLRFFAGGNTHTREEKQLIGNIVNEMMTLLDEDLSGEVAFDEFVAKVGFDEEVWECFQSISPLTQLIEAMQMNKYAIESDL